MPTHREQVLKKLGLPKDTQLSVEELADLTDLPLEALLEVGRRGVGAWRTNIESVRLKKDFSKNPDLKRYPRGARLSPQQWSYARIMSFVNKGRTFYTADADIAKEYNLG
jgi:hypothetical protein